MIESKEHNQFNPFISMENNTELPFQTQQELNKEKDEKEAWRNDKRERISRSLLLGSNSFPLSAAVSFTLLPVVKQGPPILKKCFGERAWGAATRGGGKQEAMLCTYNFESNHKSYKHLTLTNHTDDDYGDD